MSGKKRALKVLSNMTAEKLQEIGGIGPKVAESVYNWFRDKKKIKFFWKNY